MTDRGRVLVIGGSIAGLFAAVSLRRLGFEVQVFERSAEALTNRGAGIATQNVLYEACEVAGIELNEAMGVPSVGRIMFDRHGRELGRAELHQTLTSWGLIYRFLRAQVADAIYHGDHRLVDFEQRAGGVHAAFANGHQAEGDWLVGADGVRSTVRDLVLPGVDGSYAGYFAWRGLIEESAIPPEVLTQVAHRMSFGMAPGGHWLGYLVAGREDALEPGHRWYNWAWYRTADEATWHALLTDAAGVFYPAGIPHDRVRAEPIAAMREEAAAMLAPQYQAIIAATAQPFVQGIYDCCCDRMVHGRVFLVGDAACAARPHVGCGVAKAALDAATLAVALAAPERDRALAQWESSRLRFAHSVFEWSRRLASYIGPQPEDPAHAARARRQMRPEILMTETAAGDLSQYLG